MSTLTIEIPEDLRSAVDEMDDIENDFIRFLRQKTAGEKRLRKNYSPEAIKMVEESKKIASRLKKQGVTADEALDDALEVWDNLQAEIKK